MIPLLFGCGSQEKENSNAKSGNQTLVDVSVSQLINLKQNLTVSGDIVANESVELTTESAGIVNQIYFEEGQKVQKGQTLVSLEVKDLIAERNLITVQLENAEKKEKRASAILKEKGLSDSEFEDVQLTVKEFKARQSILNSSISKKRISAPFSGTIGLRWVSPGAYIGANSKVATLVDNTQLKIEFSVTEEYANNIQIGDSVSFTISGSEKIRKAIIYAKQAQIDRSTRSLTFRAKYKNTDDLVAGAFAKVTVAVKDFENAVVVPNQAVVPNSEGKSVFVYKSGIVKTQQVSSGIRKSDVLQITEGLSAGDTIVVNGLLQIRDGQNVQIRKINPMVIGSKKID